MYNYVHIYLCRREFVGQSFDEGAKSLVRHTTMNEHLILKERKSSYIAS